MLNRFWWVPQIIKITNHLEFELLGETIDDAAGEAFDKSAKILGLPHLADHSLINLPKRILKLLNLENLR